MKYELPVERQQAQPMTPVAMPDVKDYSGEQLAQMGGALQKVGVAEMTIQHDIDTAKAKEKDNELADIMRVSLYDPEVGYLKTAGKNALDGRADVIKSIKEKTQEIETGLQSDIQRLMFRKVSRARMQTFLASVDSHAMQQAKVYAGAEAKARMDGARMDAINTWADWSKPDGNFARSKALMMKEVSAIADLAGISGPERKNLDTAATTQLHSDVINNMISLGHTTVARDYLKAHEKEVQADKLDELRRSVKTSVTATEADDLASKIWKELAPKDRNGAVSLFQMAQRARDLAGDNEEKQKAAIAGLKERAAEWDKEQLEFKSQNISGVWKLYDSGATYKTIQLSSAWLALTDTERRILKSQMDEISNRALARSAAQSQRDLTELQRQEHLAFMKNGAEYLTMTDPNVLRRMSRAQVEATRGSFGMTATQHLLDRWDAIQNPSKYKNAKMDDDDFKQIARTLSLDPDAKTSNKAMRNKLGALKFHIEQVIDYEQSQAKREFTRQEKMDLINKEIAKQVVLNPGVFSFNRKAPVISLTKEQMQMVVVPAEDRVKISEAMKIKGINPTEANLIQIYLRKISPGGAKVFEGAEN